MTALKTHAFFGLMISVASTLLVLLLYFLDFHNDPGKFLVGMILGFLAAILITIVGLVLGIRAVRAERGPGKFSYGQAFLAGLLISVFSSLFGTAFHVTYTQAINPDYTETGVKWLESMLERANAPYDKIEEAVEDMRRKSALGYQIRNGLIGGIVIGTIVSLLAAIALKRDPNSADAPAP